MQQIFFIQVIAVTSFIAPSLAARSIGCEIRNTQGHTSMCLLSSANTVIDANDITLNSRKSNIDEITITPNPKVKFLPILLHETFPNLRTLTAGSCVIQNISRSNFDKLNQLRTLHLRNNSIETIASDTFRDLVRLEILNLEENSLKYMNGLVFKFLPSIKSLSLTSNVCISKNFENTTAQSISDEVNKSCNFEEEAIIDNSGLMCEAISTAVQGNDIVTIPGEFCLLNGITVIDKRGETFYPMPDQQAIGLLFENNKKIEYLPVKVHRAFPNLADYRAEECSIREISRKNFEKLDKLRIVMLGNNQIEKVPSDTFAELPLLLYLGLRYNKIKQINSKFLQKFDTNLNMLGLGHNDCFPGIGYFEYVDNSEVTRQLDESDCGFEETIEPPFENLLNTSCGTVSFATGLIIKGTEAKKGSWPFLVGLFYLSTMKFFCGSSLISAKHLLTAAHCIHPKYTEKPHDFRDIAAVLGHHNFGAAREEGSVTRTLSRVIIHQEWKPNDIKYDADLAVLVMNREVEFSTFIQPVCITTEPDINRYNDGYVTGWGKSEFSRDSEKIPRQASIRSVTSEVCFEKEPILGNMFSRRSYCAGGEGSGPCSGDSGGGFYVNFDGFWTIRGIISVGPYNIDTCDVDTYALYTNVFDFTSWIKRAVNEN